MLLFITSFLTLEDNCYANYLTGAWISGFDPCISRGRFLGLKRSTYTRVNTVLILYSVKVCVFFKNVKITKFSTCEIK